MIHTKPETITLAAGEAEGGQRLDRFIVSTGSGCSRNTAVRLIREGQVRVNRIIKKKPGYRIAPGDIVTCPAGPAQSDAAGAPEFLAEPIDLDILYADASVIGINKPPGLVVHPAAGHFSGTLAHGLIHHFPELRNVGDTPGRPGVVHRLDKDTSGVLVAARTQSAYLDLVRQFKNRLVKKSYLAFVHGNPDTDTGRIVRPVYRHPVHRKKMAAGPPGTEQGRYAETRWRVRQRYGRLCMLECGITTGRTHQIRVHLAAIGHPVVGDATYGYKHPRRRYADQPQLARIIGQVPRQMLHARKLAFTHPSSGCRLTLTAPLPEDMVSLEKDLQKAIYCSSP